MEFTRLLIFFDGTHSGKKVIFWDEFGFGVQVSDKTPV